jgi:hypothetical protein
MWKGPVTKHYHIYYNSLLLYAETAPLWTGAVRRNSSKQTKCRFSHVSTFHTEKPIFLSLYDRRTWKFFVHWVVSIVTIAQRTSINGVLGFRCVQFDVFGLMESWAAFGSFVTEVSMNVLVCLPFKTEATSFSKTSVTNQQQTPSKVSKSEDLHIIFWCFSDRAS